MSSSGAKRKRTATGKKTVGEVLNDLDQKVTFIEDYLRNQSKQLKKELGTVFRKLNKIEDHLAQEGYETETQETPPRTGNTSSSDEDEDLEEGFLLPPTNSLKY